MTTGRKTILLTGAEGVIGSHLRQVLASTNTLRLLTREPVPGVESVVTDVADFARVREACEGVDCVIHLAACAYGGASWDELLPGNIVGAYNIFEAARQAGVAQVIFASSNHAVAGHEREHAPEIYRTGRPAIDHLVELRPANLYGASKAFGEILGRLYAEQHGLRVICLRIGYVTPHDSPKTRRVDEVTQDRLTALWISKRDMAQLVEKSLLADQVQFAVVNGVSNNRGNYLDLSHTQNVLGYVPLDSAEERVGERM